MSAVSPHPTDAPPAIAVRDVSKIFPRDYHDSRSMKEILTFRSRGFRAAQGPLTALRGVSFEVRPGEMVGVIGTNGAGKSTLLRVLAGITPPTSGSVECRGRIGTLLELGAGFQGELSGMENIYLTAAVAGVERERTEAVLDDILDFAELRPFIHTPVKHYSSGMYVRLGFSIAVHLAPEILLVDEVLAVGDPRFQHLSFERIVELRRGGTSAVLVSHDLNSLEALCDRLVWLHAGEVRAWGDTAGVLADYRTFLKTGTTLPELRQVHPGAVDFLSNTRVGSGDVTVDAVRILGPDGRETQTLRPGKPMAIELAFHARRRVDDADLVLVIEHEGLRVSHISAEQHGCRLIFEPGRGTIRVDFPECVFTMGAYLLTVAVVHRHVLSFFYDNHIRLHRFAVINPAPSMYSPPLRFPVQFSLECDGD
jgi:ABC-type polysaccharide/polyol phosphate transport system ATPase subunit